MTRFSHYYQYTQAWYRDLVATELGRRSFRWLIFGSIAIPLIGSSFQRLPSGHVGVVQNIFGNCRPYVFDEDFAFWTIPFYEKVYPLRVWPVRKRLIQEFTTKDGKIVEAVLHLRLKAKICWAQDIVCRMGLDFSRTFLEQEVSLDTESIVSEHTYEELIAHNETTETIIDELIGRTREAAVFCRLELLDMTVLFRDPLDAS